MKTNNIKLRSLRLKEATTLAELMNNENILNNLRDHIPNPYTYQNGLDFIKLCRAEKPARTFGIHYNKQLVGVIGLVIDKRDSELAEVGYWIGEPFWNLGIASVALQLIINYGFGKLKLRSIFASTFSFNEASKQVLLKAGFEIKNLEEKAYVKKGIDVDMFHFNLTKDQFECLMKK